MKILSINFDYYELPSGMDSVEQFIEHIEKQKSMFVKLKQFLVGECIFPYLVAEDVKEVYLNTTQIDVISEEDATVLTRAEYDSRLKEVVTEKCVNCSNYMGNCETDDLEGHRGMMSLDGACYMFEKLGE